MGHRYTLKPDYIFGVEQREEDTRSLQFDALAAEHGVITCYHGTVRLQSSACFSKFLAPWPCSCTDSFGGGADDPINPLPSAAFSIWMWILLQALENFQSILMNGFLSHFNKVCDWCGTCSRTICSCFVVDGKTMLWTDARIIDRCCWSRRRYTGKGRTFRPISACAWDSFSLGRRGGGA